MTDVFTSADLLKIVGGAIAALLGQHWYKTIKRRKTAIRLTTLVRTETDNNRNLATKARSSAEEDLASITAALDIASNSKSPLSPSSKLPDKLFELHFPLLAFRSAAWLAASRSNALDDSDANSAYAVEAPYSIIRQIEHLNEAIIGAPSMILLHSLAGPADVHTLDVKDFVDCLRRARLLVASQHAMFTELVKASEHSLQASKEILMSLEARTKLHLIRRKTS